VALTTDAAGAPIQWVYFWMTGVLSSFLDNAPTHPVFFNLAGGDPHYTKTLGLRPVENSCSEAKLPPAAGAIGPRPHFFTKSCNELTNDSLKNGVWGLWPQPPEALEFDESSFAGFDIT